MKNLFLFAFFCLSFSTFGQPGSLDNSFEMDGKLTSIPFGDDVNEGHGIAIQSDGKIVVCGVTGSANMLVIRYNTDGSLDQTFQLVGYRSIEINGQISSANCLAIQPDGKIVIGGWSYTNSSNIDFTVVRLNTDGTLDSLFGLNGVARTGLGNSDYIQSIALQNDGKIVVAGEVGSNQTGSSCAIVRFTDSGLLDTTFNHTGKVITDINPANADGINSVVVTSNNDIVVGGYMYFWNGIINQQNWILAKYNSFGQLDSNFNSTGIMIGDTIEDNKKELVAVAIQPDGKLVCAGYKYIQNGYDILVARYNIDGSYDTGFNNSGFCHVNVQAGDFATSLLLQPDGKIVVGGNTNNVSGRDFLLVCVEENGLPDQTFGNGGYAITDIDGDSDFINGIALQQDNKIVAVGYSYEGTPTRHATVARYLTGLSIGILELSPTETPPLLYPNPLQNTEVLKYTLADDDQISIVLLDGQGKLVATFVENEKQEMGDHEVELNLPNGLPSGNYFIQIASPKGKISIKAIK